MGNQQPRPKWVRFNDYRKHERCSEVSRVHHKRLMVEAVGIRKDEDIVSTSCESKRGLFPNKPVARFVQDNVS